MCFLKNIWFWCVVILQMFTFVYKKNLIRHSVRLDVGRRNNFDVYVTYDDDEWLLFFYTCKYFFNQTSIYNLVPHTVPRLSALAQADYTTPVAPQPGFSCSEEMINHFQKIQQELQTTPGCKSHRFVSLPRFREAMYSPLELSSTDFLFPWDSPVVDMGFTEISRSQVGGA